MIYHYFMFCLENSFQKHPGYLTNTGIGCVYLLLQNTQVPEIEQPDTALSFNQRSPGK